MLLNRIDRNIEAPNKVNVIDAIQLAVASWELDVKRDTIKNCFSHCKIRSDHLVDGPAPDLDVNPPAEVIEELPMKSRLVMSPLRRKSLHELPIQCL